MRIRGSKLYKTIITNFFIFICLYFAGHGSDNVTIISTELSLSNALKMTTPETNEELLSK